MSRTAASSVLLIIDDCGLTGVERNEFLFVRIMIWSMSKRVIEIEKDSLLAEGVKAFASN
ncbi:unnamed protein product [Notodromas monacha]|uniref:Uncharacterized protein n=1 Tax=Notodromas monacha TaxID=399045 RepID=A0A7R9BZS5_9CRUS|nr:unnamed protein product [Notodromas monacha]CAG0923344.1 unnamed protein product [Notodromas monacha]